MIDFKFLIPEQIILKRRSLFTNLEVSLWNDAVSVEEGWGTQGNYKDYGRNFGACTMAGRVCKPKMVNGKIKKFNKP